ncbi:hypothetical protein BsIDN1_35860 [Bacillus safensis]|uniref:FAD/NAD(P)-binding domain-containing protein n=1 Tax=Bacillus safensis TaxID=561879 RepID=A0A5S9MAP1_BACIA|nr:hypothetical protein BsIDN1_35860 [Bacillus safensis]
MLYHEEKLVLVGNGMAGIRSLENILKTDSERFDMTVFGTEPHPNYNRILFIESASRGYEGRRYYVKRLELVS